MSSTKSAFGASPFATSGASTTGFGSLGQTGFSAFGSFTQSHGKLSNFGSSNAPASFSGTAGKLTSFASPNAPASFSDSKDKTLGAAKSDDEESDNEKDGEADDTFVAEKTDERFHEHTSRKPSLLPRPRSLDTDCHSPLSLGSVETGEENESNEFSAKGKLYYFDDKKWKERGAGTFKVNSKTDPDGKKSARMIMRADGAHRVMLNSAIWKSMPFGVKGQRPTTKDIYLASKEDNKVSTLLLRVRILILSSLDVHDANQHHSSAMRSRPGNFMKFSRSLWGKSKQWSAGKRGIQEEKSLKTETQKTQKTANSDLPVILNTILLICIFVPSKLGI